MIKIMHFIYDNINDWSLFNLKLLTENRVSLKFICAFVDRTSAVSIAMV